LEIPRSDPAPSLALKPQVRDILEYYLLKLKKVLLLALVFVSVFGYTLVSEKGREKQKRLVLGRWVLPFFSSKDIF